MLLSPLSKLGISSYTACIPAISLFFNSTCFGQPKLERALKRHQYTIAKANIYLLVLVVCKFHWSFLHCFFIVNIFWWIICYNEDVTKPYMRHKYFHEFPRVMSIPGSMPTILSVMLNPVGSFFNRYNLLLQFARFTRLFSRFISFSSCGMRSIIKL